MADRTDRPEQVDDPALIAAARHALHDEELVAAYAVDGDAADDPTRARALVERCPTCRDLYDDIVAIGTPIRAAATAEMAGAVRPAPRDFRLTPMDAARLQPGNPLQRAVARLRAGAAMFGRPVGASLATLGLVGLLVGSMGLDQIAGGAAMAPQSEYLGTGASGGPPAPETTFDVFGMQPGPTQVVGRTNAGPLATPTLEKQPGTDLSTDSAIGTSTIDLLFAGSIALLVIGLALLMAGYRHARAWRRAEKRT